VVNVIRKGTEDSGERIWYISMAGKCSEM
jgi:hypothetical protein